MKFFFVLLSIFGIFVVIIAWVSLPLNTTGASLVSTDSSLIATDTSLCSTDTNSSISNELDSIFRASCMDCHATGGKAMAMSKLNFTEWENYDPGKQAKKAAAIYSEVSKGAMPPKSFTKSNPDVIPTESQITLIFKWSEKLNQKK